MFWLSIFVARHLRLGKLDMDDATNKPVGGKFGVRGYPTLKIFRNGEASDYSGPRDAAGIVEYAKTEKAKVSQQIRRSVGPSVGQSLFGLLFSVSSSALLFEVCFRPGLVGFGVFLLLFLRGSRFCSCC